MTKRKWLRAIVIGGVLLLVASFGFSRALRAGTVRRYLIAHLAASFGRPVDVSWFDFSLLDGARIEAHFVSVSDDPQFGNEYFLRSDTLTAGLRWTALFAGRFEFGPVSLSRPSLNLVRDADGHWNIERWLPPPTQPSSIPVSRPGFVGPINTSSEVRAARPTRIDVDGGRINFKLGDNKSPFALVEVSGRVEQDGSGRWQLDLEARPMRAGVELQDIGLLRLRGSIAGTSARLQPADLNLTWRAASLADALRFVRQDDFGMRGLLDVDLTARIAPADSAQVAGANSSAAQWSVSGVARLSGMHGWNLTEHENNPSANISVEMNWRPGERHAEIPKLLVEMLASHIQGAGDVDWAHGIHPESHIESSTLAFADILSWYRALQPGVPEDLRADGALGLDLKLGGWPIQFEQGAITSIGGTLAANSLRAPLQIGAVTASVVNGGFDFSPMEFLIPPDSSAVESNKNPSGSEPRNSFVVRGAFFPQPNRAYLSLSDWDFSVEGATTRLQDWLALSGAVAQPVNLDWTGSGGLAIKIRGTHRAPAPAAAWIGTIDFLGLDLSPAYVNQPVRLSKAHVDFAPLQRTITISAADAFGTLWHGSIARKNSDKDWTFDLSADHLDVADLDRWLGPRARPGFLARFTGSNAAAAAPLPDAVVTRLSAHGRLRVGAIDMLPMHIEKFDGQAELTGRVLHIRKAQADFFGGKISAASLDAQLLPDPFYDFQGHFDRVDLAQLGRAVPFLNDRIGGTASATLTLSAHGIGRQDLVRSMQGQGTLDGRNVELRGLDLSSLFVPDNSASASEVFSSVQGMVRVQNSGIDLANFTLDNSRGRLDAEGRIDFSHALNIRVHPTILKAAKDFDSGTPPSFLLGGTIETPEQILPNIASKPPVRPSSR